MTTLPPADELRRLLYTPVLSDVLDSFGLMRQALRPFVRPLDEALVLFGRARTGRYVADRYRRRRATIPTQLEMDLIDDLKPGEVPVLACGGPTDWIAPWGELLSTAARARGAAGCVTDGLVRDVARIRAMRFPVFHGGIGPLDTKGRAEMVEKDTADRHCRRARRSRRLGDGRRRWRGVHPGRQGGCGVPRRARQDRSRGHDARGTRGGRVAARGVCPPRGPVATLRKFATGNP